uniref:Peptidase S1 domain-containing protein n=1 Tax=Heliothis virescens TaxID=7102 RepID=A0A2A4K1H5_HELVI
MSCGIDNFPSTHVYEGTSRIEYYPWLGILYYHDGVTKFTTAVVLVTRQIVLGAASEIDKMPQDDFRARVRVVVGYNCSGPSIGIRDYSYHPDYSRESFSTLAMIQLETDAVDIGFGMYGPGCQSPARFLDYGMYHDWVQRSVQRIGKPAITTLGDNHVVLRRSLSNVQRYGPCDREETKRELYTDFTEVPRVAGVVRYNVTIITDVEYSCVVFKATYAKVTNRVPKIRLRRWCVEDPGVCCGGFQFAEILFFVEITFTEQIWFKVMAYGREAIIIDAKKAIEYLNDHAARPEIFKYEHVKNMTKAMRRSSKWPWFG